MYRNNNKGNRNFDHHNSHHSNSYPQSDNRRNYGPIKNQGQQRFYDQRYNDNQDYNGGRSNRSNNYSNYSNPRRNDNLSERPCRGGPHQSLRPGRTAHYDPYDSRSRQSSVRPRSRVRHTSQEEDNILAGWGDDLQRRR